MADKSKPTKVPRTLKRTLITPEGVDLGVELAPLGVRLAAVVLDLIILVAVLIAFWLIVLAAELTSGRRAPAELTQIIGFLGFFVLRNAWFIGWEMTPAAATPGKRVTRIRVAMRNGGRLTADAVFARNVTREMEMFLPLVGLVGASSLAADSRFGAWMGVALLAWTLALGLIPLFNRDRLRAGDLLAGTWVVLAPRHALEPDLARDAAERRQRFTFTLAQLDAYGVMELQVLEGVLRQMDKLVLRDVAKRIRAKIGWQDRPDETDAEFLRAYYAALRERLEGRMLMGHRRKDKHDRAGLAT